MKRKYNSIWFSTLQGKCIGIVKNLSSGRCYIGVGTGLNEPLDEQFIAEFGTPFDIDKVKKFLR